jgi:hypothetical protein
MRSVASFVAVADRAASAGSAGHGAVAGGRWCGQHQDRRAGGGEVGDGSGVAGPIRRGGLGEAGEGSGRARPQVHDPATSWLNQVERWFALLTDKRLRRGTHTSVAALEKDIRSWISTWNEDPKPFAWTKTADEILDRLTAYLQRISDAGH